jgi:hypothetical protein
MHALAPEPHQNDAALHNTRVVRWPPDIARINIILIMHIMLSKLNFPSYM